MLDGSKPIGLGTVVYEMKYTDSKTLTFLPGRNAYVNKVEINGHRVDVSKLSSISIHHMEQDVKIYVEFGENVKEEQPSPQPSTPTVVPEPKPETELGKDVIIIITQDIPQNEINGEITEDFIRKYLKVNSDYEILSHNIQNRPGTYEVVIRLPDGTIRKVPIRVVAPEAEEEISGEIGDKECRIHIVMLLLLLLYSGYNLVDIVIKKRKISTLKRQGKEENE